MAKDRQSLVFEMGQDPRQDFMFDFTSHALSINVDNWQQMLSVEENRSTLNDFFESEEIPVRLVTFLSLYN